MWSWIVWYGRKIRSVSYGGNQDEKDGGIDVQISCSNLENGDFIPSQNTIFQVKKPKMSASKIKKKKWKTHLETLDGVFPVYQKKAEHIGLVTLNWTVFKRTVTIENQEKR